MIANLECKAFCWLLPYSFFDYSPNNLHKATNTDHEYILNSVDKKFVTQPLASVFSIFRANVMNMLTIARNLFYDNDKYVILSITEIHITAYMDPWIYRQYYNIKVSRSIDVKGNC